MKDLIFIFGRAPELSLAELIAVFGAESIRQVSKEYAIARVDAQINAASIQRRLGGIIKIGEVVDRVEPNGIHNAVKNFLQGQEKGIFGFSAYAKEGGVFLRDIRRGMNETGVAIKKDLKAEGMRSRFVVSREETLSSAAVEKNKLTSTGVEFLFLAGKHDLIMGKTLTVQDFEEYNRRDYGRPCPSPLSGMLPPKVAQIMINLSGISKDETLLDPFCGSGTVLQEAAYQDIQNIIGADIDAETIDDAKKNLEWFVLEFQMKPQTLNFFSCDVRNISKNISPNSIDAIITEPTMGPPLRGHESIQQLQKNRDELECLFLDAFGQFVRILRAGGTVVFTFPIMQKGPQKFEIRNLAEIQKLGFRVKPLFSDLKIPIPFRPNRRDFIVYARDDQRVAREIAVLEKL